MPSDQSEPFLPKKGSEDGEDALGYQRNKSRSDRWFSTHSLRIYDGLISCYTIFSFLIIASQLRTARCIAQDYDREHAIPVDFTFKPTISHNLSGTPYAGEKPTEVFKAAWDDLLQSMNMRFSQEEIDAVNQESVALLEGGGCLGWFGVFHNLHCVVSSATPRSMLVKADTRAENDTRALRKS
ncbi:hypothetical protein BU23DRAFT_457430 [Bimuria novae-zelandiae CBS 107.79]|uniref:Uncharacterized protein n=1 Tax=Bimuria novae-zelandiae CBS 107.79 TaxID=1447943 RepID=A0A6A5VHI7_9PLEO|nr:hypothetical protein BU23DRAFT_457430 [Bimuria novae-zelandiae CBS 107.79]